VLTWIGWSVACELDARAQRDSEIDDRNVQKIGELLPAFLHGYHGQYPPRLSTLVLERPYWSDLNFMCLAADHHGVPGIPRDASRVDWATYADVIDQNCDYRYIAGNYVETDDFERVRERIILLYSKRERCGGRWVLFANYTRRIVKTADLSRVFAENNAARKTLGIKTEIVLDAPPPPAP